MRLALATLRRSGLALVPGAPLAFLAWGAEGLEGLLLGAFVALFSVGSFGMLAWLAARQGDGGTPFGAFTVLVFLFKLPLFWVVISRANDLGATAVGCFLGGLGLVYSVLVLVALAENRAGSQGPFL